MGERKNKVFGLLGKDIEYSFSRGYFTEKFEIFPGWRTTCGRSKSIRKWVSSKTFQTNKIELLGARGSDFGAFWMTFCFIFHTIS